MDDTAGNASPREMCPEMETIKTETVVYSELFSCSMCELSFTSEEVLLHHVTLSHGEADIGRSATPDGDYKIERLKNEDSVDDGSIAYSSESPEPKNSDSHRPVPETTALHELFTERQASESSDNEMSDSIREEQDSGPYKTSSLSHSDSSESDTAEITFKDRSKGSPSNNDCFTDNSSPEPEQVTFSQSGSSHRKSSVPAETLALLTDPELSHALSLPVVTTQGSVGPYNCHLCGAGFQARLHLTRHLLTHRPLHKHKCTSCGIRFENELELISHQRSEECARFQARLTERVEERRDIVKGDASKEKPFQCNECPRRYALASSLKSHQLIHSPDNPLHCTVCERRFTKSAHLKQHMLVHTKVKAFACTYCPRRFYTKTNLTTHHRTHTGERPYPCTLCDKRFFRNGDLNEHMKRHRTDRPYECTVCGMKFRMLSALGRHLRTHTKEKPFTCSQCSRSFSQRDQLRLHMRTHNGQRDFACTFCPKAFTRKCYLTVHLRTHTLERPYPCPQCNRCFITTYSRQVHQLSHTDSRPFSCTECCKTFKSLNTLKRHQKSHQENPVVLKVKFPLSSKQKTLRNKSGSIPKASKPKKRKK